MKIVGAFAALALMTGAAVAQDVPGIEICTVDKTMEKRTSCLQSNVEFLVKTINRLKTEHEQKLDAASRQIVALKASIAELQKSVADAHAKADAAIRDAPAKGALAPVAKETRPSTEPAPTGK